MRKRRHSILDVLTSALLYATMMVGGIYLYIFVDPQSFINPFPPPPLAAAFSLAAASASTRSRASQKAALASRPAARRFLSFSNCSWVGFGKQIGLQAI